jgi:hypothetical protein
MVNNSEFEEKVRSLPLTEGEKNGILQLGAAPGRFPWFRVVLFLTLGSFYVWFGWEAMVFTLGEGPPQNAEPVSARSAHATARLVGLFFIGILFSAAAILTTFGWWGDRANALTVRNIIALLTQHRERGEVQGATSGRALPASRSDHA